MSEPGLLQAESAARQDNLWEKAPAWRNLTIAASLLTLAAVATPMLLPQAQDTAPQTPSPKVSLAAPTAKLSAVPKESPAPPAQIAPPATPKVAAPQTAAPAQHVAVAPAQPAANPIPSAACAINLSTQAQAMGGGTVLGFENAQEAQLRMRTNEQSMGGLINPAYAITPRAIVRPDGSVPGGMSQIVVVPPNMTVNPGDHITFSSIHRDTSMPCGFIPPLVTADTGPAQSDGASAPATAPGTQGADALFGPGLTIPSGVMARVDTRARRSQGRDWPVTIKMVSAPAHGKVTTKFGMGSIRMSDGPQFGPQTQIFYQSDPGFTGSDSFTYQRNSDDPTDPLSGNVYTVNVDVR